MLGDADLLWCPRGSQEGTAGLLGPVAGLDVLEIGCGAAQGARWLVGQGAHVAAFDVSFGQLQQARELDARSGIAVPRLVQADAQQLPFRNRSFDVAVSAFGALPFVADVPGTLAEVARVLRPAGRLVFSVTHPLRWAFPDDPGPAGLTVRQSYFDRTPYVEESDGGRPTSSTTEPSATGCAGSWARASAARRDRARVARGPHRRVGPVVSPARRPRPRHRHLPRPPPLTPPAGQLPPHQGVFERRPAPCARGRSTTAAHWS